MAGVVDNSTIDIVVVIIIIYTIIIIIIVNWLAEHKGGWESNPWRVDRESAILSSHML